VLPAVAHFPPQFSVLHNNRSSLLLSKKAGAKFGWVQALASQQSQALSPFDPTSPGMVKPAPSSALAKELRRIGASWPPDILRPRLQYGVYLAALAESQHISPRMVRASQLLLENKLKEKVRSFHSVFPNHAESLIFQTVRLER
jgi:hypothetical protein